MATIKEVANRAGVSTTTVSNVIHGKTKRVSVDAYGEMEDGQENHVVNIGLDDESGGYKMTRKSVRAEHGVGSGA